MELTLFKNSIDFLSKGIDDFIEGESSQDDWYFKYAIINISQGVELLLKHILLEKHKIFIYKDIDKDNDDEKNIKTVDFMTAINRINKLYEIKISDKQIEILTRVRDRRNDYMHYEVNIDNYHHAVAVVSKTFPVIDQLLQNYLETKLIDEIPSEIWEEFIKIDRIHKDYFNDLKGRFELITLGNAGVPCSVCGISALHTNNEEVKCVYCQSEYLSLEEAIASIATESKKKSFINFLITEKELKTHHCSKCTTNSIVYSEKMDDLLCLECNENTVNNRKIIQCISCSKQSAIIISEELEQEEALCINCGIEIQPDSCTHCGLSTFDLRDIQLEDYESMQENGAPERISETVCDGCYYSFENNTRYALV